MVLEYSVMDEQQQQRDQPQVVPPQWQYQSGQLEQQAGPPTEESQVVDSDEGYIRWSASEFVSHEKSSGWFLALGAIAVLVAAILFLFTREIFSVVVVLVLAVALGVFGTIKPRILDYTITPDGISIGEKFFGYDTFRSFSVIEDGPAPYIQLLPQKRLMAPITIYFNPANGDNIIELLGSFLPFEHKERDLVDKITSRIRF